MRAPAPSTSAGARGFRALLDDPARGLVGLDFDGTLSPIVADPELARPVAGAVQTVRRLAAHVATVAIVTGRPARTAARLLELERSAPSDPAPSDPAPSDPTPSDPTPSDPTPSNLVVLGHYGLERWTARDGVVRRPGFDEAALDAVRAELPSVLAKSGAGDVAVEDKGESVAVHARRAADPERALALLREPLTALATSHGLRLEPGRLVWELRPTGIDKGIALEELARERAASATWYAGDDLGDIAAYDALDRLRRESGACLAIYSRADDVAETVPALLERADLVVDGPLGLVRFLDDVCVELDANGR